MPPILLRKFLDGLLPFCFQFHENYFSNLRFFLIFFPGILPNKESKILQLEEIFKPYNSSKSLKETMVPVKKLVNITSSEKEWSTKLKSIETKSLHVGCKNSIQTKTMVPFGVSLIEDVLLVESQDQILPLSISPNLVKLYCHTVSQND